MLISDDIKQSLPGLCVYCFEHSLVTYLRSQLAIMPYWENLFVSGYLKLLIT